MADPARFALYDGGGVLLVEQTPAGVRLTSRDGEILVSDRMLRWLLAVSGPAVLDARAREQAERRVDVLERQGAR